MVGDAVRSDVRRGRGVHRDRRRAPQDRQGHHRVGGHRSRRDEDHHRDEVHSRRCEDLQDDRPQAASREERLAREAAELADPWPTWVGPGAEESDDRSASSEAPVGGPRQELARGPGLAGGSIRVRDSR